MFGKSPERSITTGLKGNFEVTLRNAGESSGAKTVGGTGGHMIRITDWPSTAGLHGRSGGSSVARWRCGILPELRRNGGWSAIRGCSTGRRTPITVTQNWSMEFDGCE